MSPNLGTLVPENLKVFLLLQQITSTIQLGNWPVIIHRTALMTSRNIQREVQGLQRLARHANSRQPGGKSQVKFLPNTEALQQHHISRIQVRFRILKLVHKDYLWHIKSGIINYLCSRPSAGLLFHSKKAIVF